MKIQSLSISVPSPTTKGKCINNCKFCCSLSHLENKYENNFPLIDELNKKEKLYKEDYIKRLQVARDKNVDTLIFTGEIEPLQNKVFIQKVSEINNSFGKDKFKNLEIQTTGVFLDDKNLEWLRYNIGITTINLSVSNIWNNNDNLRIIGCPDKLKFDLTEVCNSIKKWDFNLRLSINMLYNKVSDLSLFKRCRDLGANQVTLRKMWISDKNTKQDKWLLENKLKDEEYQKYIDFIKTKGTQQTKNIYKKMYIFAIF